MTDIGISLLIKGFMWAIGVEDGIDLDLRIVSDLEDRCTEGLDT